MAWIRVDKKQRLVEYYFYYVVSGTVEPLNESYIEIKKIGETDIFIAPKRGSPNTEMSEPYFFIAIFTLWLPWIIDDVDMDEL